MFPEKKTLMNLLKAAGNNAINKFKHNTLK